MAKTALPRKEYLGHIIHTMTRYFDNEPLTSQEIKTFLKSLAVDDIEPSVVQEAYERSRNKYYWQLKY
jgi:hypothetical protein